MAKIRMKVDTSGDVVLRAPVVRGAGVTVVQAKAPAEGNLKDVPREAWRQLVFELLAEKERVLTGASKPGTGVK